MEDRLNGLKNKLNSKVFKNFSFSEERQKAIKEGILYTLLHRMEQKGLLSSEWVVENNKKRKYYSITSKGKRILMVC